jgi:hypothetical protein
VDAGGLSRLTEQTVTDRDTLDARPVQIRESEVWRPAGYRAGR